MSDRQRIPRNGKTLRQVAEGTGMSVATIARWTSEPRADYLARADEKRARAVSYTHLTLPTILLV